MEKEDMVSDREYDEAIPVESEDEDDVSTPASSEMPSPSSQKSPQASGLRGSPPQRGQGGKPAAGGGDEDEESESGESGSSEATSTSDSSNDGEEGSKSKSSAPAGGYNPDEFKGMKVSSEIEELFQYITRYKPHTIELDTSLKPFIPELIPSISEVDAFIKMPRPDAQPTGLGTTRLDEPTMNPSDPAILDLQLRSLSKNQDLQPMEVRSIENAWKAPKEIENWIRRIDDLNRSKPAPTVPYSRRMPDIEHLLQVWPAEFEEYLQQNPLPDMADLELDLPSYIRIIASILDVPVYSQLTESLHVIFTLYAEFTSNQHFSKTDNAGNFGGPDPYSFPVGPFTQGGGGASVSPGAAGPMFGGQPMESVAPSRAPSPVGQNQNQMQLG